MSFPFSEQPRLNEYLRNAEKLGCTVRSGVTTDPDGRPCSAIYVLAPNGKHVVIVDMLESERLAPATVAYYDRRLDMKSVYPSPEIPQSGED